LIFVSTAYSYAPFLLAASLSIFPLTAVESALLSLPILSIVVESLLSHPELFASASATFLRLFLLLGISALAGMSQVRLLIALTEQSTRDRLTGVLTRRAGEFRINSSFRLAKRAQQPLSLLFFDLDHFKSINDRFGHAAGDAILQSAARSISLYLKSDAALIRWGGEEFVVLLPQAGLSAAREIVQQIGAEGFGRTPDGAQVTASVGIAEWIRDTAPDPAALVRLSDRRMYAAKSAGRNCYVSDSGVPTRFVDRENEMAADIPAWRHSTSVEPRGWIEPKTLLAS
jgi:diguanylate cyclase (GGDEF)-like protein